MGAFKHHTYRIFIFSYKFIHASRAFIPMYVVQLCMLHLLPKACEYVGPFVLQLKTFDDAEVCLNPGAVLLPAASICQ